MARKFEAVGLALLILVAGCSIPGFPTTTGENVSPDETLRPSPTEPGTSGGPSGATPTPTPGTSAPTTTADEIPDPPDDRLGWEDGYWYNESLSLTPNDGYDREELERIVARTMGRLEILRGLEFTDSVLVQVISREQYRSLNVFEFEPDPFRDQVYEALFLVGEDANASESLESIYNGSVAGYYSNDVITIVATDPDSIRIGRSTLAHELVHALQDDHLHLQGEPTTLDERMAIRGLTEGEANYVMDRYQERCAAEWECIQKMSGSATKPDHMGVFQLLLVPYSEGPTLVGDLVNREGWDAVSGAYEQPPVSTEQLIHPKAYPNEEPIDLRVENRSSGDWRRISRQGRSHERVGEAALYVMFWYNGVIPKDHLDTDATRNNYSHQITAGWNGDALIPYQNGAQFGYVFVTAWDTERDARQFHEAYIALLNTWGAKRINETVYVIPDNRKYGDAFRVVRRGKQVIVVNGPTVDALDDIHRPKNASVEVFEGPSPAMIPHPVRDSRARM